MMNTVKKAACAVGLAAVLTVGMGGVANAAPPGPENGTSKIAYQINTGDLCREQYQRSDAWADNGVLKFDNYSLQCRGFEASLSIPGGASLTWTRLGSLKIQQYCDTFYKGSRAKPIGKSANPQDNWFCVYK